MPYLKHIQGHELKNKVITCVDEPLQTSFCRASREEQTWSKTKMWAEYELTTRPTFNINLV